MVFDRIDKNIPRLDEHLRTAHADRLSDAQHTAIETGVLERLRRNDLSTKRPAPPPPRHWRPIAAGIAAAAMVLIAATVLMQPKEPQPQPLDLAALVELWQDSEHLAQRIPHWTRWPEQSMQAEMNRLTSDTRRAVAFLLSCTPGNPLPETQNGY